MSPDYGVGVIEDLLSHWSIGHSIALLAGILVAVVVVLPVCLLIRRLMWGPRESRSGLAKRIDNLQLERNRWEKASTVQEKAKDEWKRKSQEISVKHNDLARKFNQLVRKYKELAQTASDHLGQMQSQVATLEQENHGITLKYQELDKQLEDMLREKQGIGFEKQFLNEKNHILSQEVLTLTYALSDLRLQLNTQSLRHQQGVQNLFAQGQELRQQLQNVLQEQQNLHIEIESLNTKNRDLNQEVAALADKNGELQDQILCVDQHRHKLLQQVSDFREQLENLGHENQEIERRALSSDRQNGKLVIELNKCYQEAFALEEQLKKLTSQNQTLENEHRELATLNEQLHADKVTVYQEAEKQSQENRALRDRATFIVSAGQAAFGRRLAGRDGTGNCASRY